MWRDEKGFHENFIHDKTHKNPDYVAECCLESMLGNESVDVWWAHNMGKFDGLFLSSAAFRLGWRQEAIMAGGNRVIGLKLSPPGSKRKIEVKDSYALAPSSLASLAKDFELPSAKEFTKDDYKIDARKWDVDKLRRGCLTDCRIVLELLDRVSGLVTEWGGELKSTFSSTALSIVLKAIRLRGLRFPIHQAQPESNEKAQECFYGGRVEVLEHCPDFWLVEHDINSSYPAAMCNPMPWKYLGHLKGRAADRWYRDGNTCMVRAEVRVSADEYLPPLPYRIEQDETSGVYFPVGKWIAWFPDVELRYAETQGVKVKVLEVLSYTSENPFDEFVKMVYAKKAMSTGAARNFCKLILNGCYGKFGQKPEVTRLMSFESEDEGLAHCWENENFVPLGDSHQILVGTFHKYARQAHYAMASTITARARIALHQFLRLSERPCYTDSDSVHSKSFSGEVGEDLGMMKLEMGKYKGTFYAPKIYVLRPEKGPPHFAAKGFPVEREKDLEAILRMEERFSDLVAQRPIPVGRMRLLKSQLRKSPRETKRIEESKVWHGSSQKRLPYPDGTTRPWTVGELRRYTHTTAKSPLLK